MNLQYAKISTTGNIITTVILLNVTESNIKVAMKYNSNPNSNITISSFNYSCTSQPKFFHFDITVWHKQNT